MNASEDNQRVQILLNDTSISRLCDLQSAQLRATLSTSLQTSATLKGVKTRTAENCAFLSGPYDGVLGSYTR
jgi:hypothetical protein